MPFKNFSMWRGRLPHWRADDVRYYVTFKSRRDLTPDECTLLMRHLMKSEGRKWDLLILCVLPSQTDLIFSVREKTEGQAFELSDIVEKAKTKVGKLIVKKTDERWPPFYNESYDRIIRDDAELEERWQSIFDSPVTHELVEDSEDWPALYVSDAPSPTQTVD